MLRRPFTDGAVPSVFVPEVKVTVLLGVPFWRRHRRHKSTTWLKTGFSGEICNFVVVVTVSTVRVKDDDVVPLAVALPENMAVIEC
jgi:hypothetical protein